MPSPLLDLPFKDAVVVDFELKITNIGSVCKCFLEIFFFFFFYKECSDLHKGKYNFKRFVLFVEDFA